MESSRNDRETNSARDRMLELASSSGELKPLTVDCDYAESYSKFIDNVPLLMVCPSPLIDFGTYVEVLKSDTVFPVVRRDMSYSVEVCCNDGASQAGSSQAPPNVNIFAPLNSIRRPVRQRLAGGNNHLNGNPEYDIYNDIPTNQLVDFQPIRTPSVTSSRLSDFEDLNLLESDPGYVELNPAVPQINSDSFQLNCDAEPFEPQYHPSRSYSEPWQVTDLDTNTSVQPLPQTVSYTPPLIPYTDSISPIIPDLVTENTPILINLPVLYIIPVIPLSIQPIFVAPIQPSSFTYLPAPLAFNCVLRTPFPQFIYSVEPCRSPGCPFSYRYRCPTPQIEHSQLDQRRRTTACQFQRSGRFSYQCSNRLSDNIEDDTPKRNNEKAPPPVRRLSDKFDIPNQSSTSTSQQSTSTSSTDTVQTMTTMLDNITLNGDTVRRTSQISVQISERNDNHQRRKYFTRTSHTVEFRRNKRTGVLRRFDKPKNMCFVKPSTESEGHFDVLKSTLLHELTLDRNRLNCANWLKVRDFGKAQRSLVTPSSLNRPYFLNMLQVRNGPLPTVLQEVTVPVINNSICESMYQSAGYIEHIPNIFICAGWRKGGFDSCEGDSGGPMVIQRPDKRWLLAGVISWGIGCAEPNQPGVYTRISAFRDWINQILQF